MRNEKRISSMSAAMALATLVLASSPEAVSAQPDAAVGYVANGLSGTISVIAVPGNFATDEIALTGTLRDVVADHGDSGDVLYVPARFPDALHIVDVTTRALRTISLDGFHPEGVVVLGRFALVTAYTANRLLVLDLSLQEEPVVRQIPVGMGPNKVVVTPDGGLAYVTNTGDDTVSVIDTSRAIGVLPDDPVVATIPVGTAPVGIAVTPAGDYVYVVNSGDGSVSVIQRDVNTVVGPPIDVGLSPVRIAISQTGTPLAYVTDYGRQKVAVIDANSSSPMTFNTVVQTIDNVGPNPLAIAITPGGGLAYLTNLVATADGEPDNGLLSTIDTASGVSTPAVVKVGRLPLGIAMRPVPPPTITATLTAVPSETPTATETPTESATVTATETPTGPTPTATEPPTPGSCCAENFGRGCDNSACQSCVCAEDPYCCTMHWDNVCAQEASSGTCELSCGCATPTPTPTTPIPDMTNTPTPTLSALTLCCTDDDCEFGTACAFAPPECDPVACAMGSGACGVCFGAAGTPTPTPTFGGLESPTSSPTETVTRSPSVTATATPTQMATSTPTPLCHELVCSPTQRCFVDFPWDGRDPYAYCCDQGGPCATPTRVRATPTPSPTPSASASPSLTPTASPSVTVTATVSASPSASPTRSATQSTTVTASRTATVTPTRTATATATVAPTKTPTLTPSTTATPTPSASRTPSVTQTASPSVTITATASADPTASRTPSATQSATVTPSGTTTVTPTHTHTATPSGTTTVTPTAAPTTTPTPTLGPTIGVRDVVAAVFADGGLDPDDADVNRDGRVTIADLAALLRRLLQVTGTSRARRGSPADGWGG
jgi:YVTN family beta-propeller protein